MADYNVHFNWQDETLVASASTDFDTFANGGPTDVGTFTAQGFYTETLTGEVQHG